MAGEQSDFVFTRDDFKFHNPSGMLIIGPSGCGKTTLLKSLIKQRAELWEPQNASVLYCYGEYHPYVDELKSENINTHFGVPSDELIDSLPKPLLCVLDDLIHDVDPEFINKMYTKKSHHHNISIVTLAQSLFLPILRIPKINSHYIFLLRAPAYRLQIRNFGAQIFAGKVKEFLKAFDDCTSVKFGYLLVNLHTRTHPLLTLTSNILSTEYPTIYKI